MLIPHCVKGQGEVMAVILSPRTRWTFPYLWQLSHFLTKFAASCCIVGQKQPVLIIFLTRDFAPMWSPQMPSWTSSKMHLNSSSSTHLKQGCEKSLLQSSSLSIVNLAARFLIFLASSGLGGNYPSLIIQLELVCTRNAWISSMLGDFCSSNLHSVTFA